MHWQRDVFQHIPDLKNFVSLAVTLPALVVFISNTIAIHSLWTPEMSRIKATAVYLYIFFNFALTSAMFYIGANQSAINTANEKHALEVEGKIDTIRAILGSAPGTPGEEVLNRIIAKFSQPDSISPAQMAKMAHEIAFLKPDLPSKISIVRSTPNLLTGRDYALYPQLNEMFSRNGYEVTMPTFTPGSLDEQGLIIVVKDPLNPPLVIKKLLAAFQLAGISDVKTKYIKSLFDAQTLTILIGPPPI